MSWFWFYNVLHLAKNLKNLKKCQISAIFMIAEIHKIDLEALFFRILKTPTIKIQIFG